MLQTPEWLHEAEERKSKAIQIYEYFSVLFWQNALELRLVIERVLKTFQKHHESIPGKILHKNDDPKIFSTFFFG